MKIENGSQRSAGFPGGVSDLNLVIHDLKNSVGVLLLLLDVSRRAGNEGEAARLAAQLLEVMRRLRGQLDAAEGEVRTVMGDRSVPITGRLAPDRVVGYVAGVFARVAPTNVRVVAEVAAGLPVVMMGDIELERCLTNLLVNGVEVLASTGGTLTVRAELAQGGRAVFITVADTGPGLPPERLARLGEPGGSTKPNGHGLGLASVWRLVAECGGTVSVVSAPGAGTRFSLSLPVV